MDTVLALVRWALMLWGLVYFVTQSLIFRRVRMVALEHFFLLGQLLYCPSCAGFWLGILIGPMFWPWVDDPSGAWPALLIPYRVYIESGTAALVMGRVWFLFAGEDTYSREVTAIVEKQRQRMQKGGAP